MTDIIQTSMFSRPGPYILKPKEPPKKRGPKPPPPVEDYFYYTKKNLKQTGYVIEIAHFNNDIFVFSSRKKKTREERKKQDSRKKSMFRAKRLINDYIHSNSWHWFDQNEKRINPLFVTLTFKENLKDLNTANYEFTKFIRRVNYELFKTKKSVIKYVCVVEFQKRGAVHYHLVIFNLPFVENIYDKFKILWPLGFSVIESVRGKQGAIGGYLTKYMAKENMDDRLSKRKSYFISRNLHKPIVTSIEEVVSLIELKIKNVPILYNRKCEFKIKNIQYEKKSCIYDLKTFPEIYNQIITILKTYEY